MAIEVAEDNQVGVPPPADMTAPPVHTGGFTVAAAHDPSKVWIHRANGEGGRFDRHAFTEHMAKAVAEFYAEHF